MGLIARMAGRKPVMQATIVTPEASQTRPVENRTSPWVKKALAHTLPIRVEGGVPR